MKQIIIVRYGELFLKGKNRNYFESVCVSNMRKALEGLEYTLVKRCGRFYVQDFAEYDVEEIIER